MPLYLSNPVNRFNQCGVTEWFETLFNDGGGTVASYIPKLFKNGYGSVYLLAYLTHHIAVPAGIDQNTADELLDYMANSGLIFYQTPGVTQTTDPAYHRFGTHIHSLPMGLYSGKPFAVDTEDNRRRHDCFLTGLMRYAIDVLGMPTNLIPFMKVYPIGYSETSHPISLGYHSDTPNLTDELLCRLRMAMCLQTKKRVSWRLYEFKERVEAVMIALEKMRVTPFKLDFSKDDLAKEWLYDEGKLKGISHDLSISKPTATHTSSNKKKKQSKVATKKNPPELKPAAKNKSASKKGGKNKPSKTPPIHPFFSTKNSKSDIDFVDLTED